MQQSKSAVTMAAAYFTAQTSGFLKLTSKWAAVIRSVRLTVLPELCFDIILGQYFLNLHGCEINVRG